MPTDAPGPRIEQPGEGPPRRRRVRGTLAQRISLVTTLVTVIAAVIVLAVAIPQIQSAGRTETQQNLARTADAVVGSIESSSAGTPVPRGLRLGRNSGQVDATLVLPGNPAPSYLGSDEVRALEQSGRLSVMVVQGDSTTVVEGRTLSDGSALILTEPLSASSAAIAGDITRLVVALAVGVAIAAIAGVVLARRLARPLKAAAATAEEMAHGRRDVVVTPEGPLEVAEVADSLNGLNAALKTSEARQREFLLSVSHELRTPLTSIRGYAEALADGVVPPEDVAGAAGRMVGETDRLERIVTDLLDLARMGAREVGIDAVETDAAQVLAAAAHVWGDNCRAEGVVFGFEPPLGPVTIVTDPVRMRQMIDNLLANALRMTPPGGPVVLAGRVDETSLVIEVRDGGPGLTDDDLGVAFEPAELYSRYRGVRQVGSGVGLALVGRLAERLGGYAVAGHAPEGGAAFTIVLPRSGPHPAVEV